KGTSLGGFDAIVLPGGFAYGDYLRCGAIARFSPIMNEVVRAAKEGRLVLGTCNGFQVLCEAGLLPGALVRNRGLRFVCDMAQLRIEVPDSADRKSTRLNSSHRTISYAVFCLKKKK